MANPTDVGSPRPEECGFKVGDRVCRIPKGHDAYGTVHQLEAPERQAPEYVGTGSVVGQTEYWRRRAMTAEERLARYLRDEKTFPPLVVIESPFRGSGAPGERERNIDYAKALLRDSYFRGEAPIASHLTGPLVLDDNNADQRDIGIAAGLAWGARGKKVIVGTDRGISAGMKIGISRYVSWGLEIVERSLGEEWKK